MDIKVALTQGSAFLLLPSHSGVFSALAGWLDRACDRPLRKKGGVSPPLSWQDDLNALYFGWKEGEEDGEKAHRREMLEVARMLYKYAQALTTVQEKIPDEMVGTCLAHLLSASLYGFQLWVETHEPEFSEGDQVLFHEHKWNDLGDKLRVTYASAG